MDLVAFTDPIELAPVNLVVSSDSKITGLGPGLTVGTLRGSIPEKIMKKDYPSVKVELFDELDRVLFALLSGRIDAAFVLTPNLLLLAKDADVAYKVRVVSPPIFEAKRGIALRKDDVGLLTSLNKTIGEFVGSPEYKKIYEKWYGKPKPWWTIGKILLLAAGIVIVVIITMAGWRHRSIVKLNRSLIANIEEREKTENALRESEENFRTLFDKSADVIFLVDSTGRIVDVNEMASVRYKYSREELLDMNVSQLDTPSDSVNAPERIGKVKKYEWAVFEVEHATKDGMIIPAEVNSRLITRNGVPLLLSNCRDITERKRAEEGLREEKERLAVTLNSIGDAVIATDVEQKITTINKVAEQLTGWSAEEAMGKPLAEVFTIINETTREKCGNPVDKVLATGLVVGLANHTALIRRDGTEIIIDDSAAPIKDRGDNTVGIVLVFRDITAEYRREQEIQKMQKLESLGLLAGGLAHDFNNLLTSIMGNVSLAKMQLGAEHTLFGRLNEVEKATERATGLTQQLLTFARGGAPVKKTASLSEIAEDACHFAMSGSNVRCSYTVPKTLSCAEVDRGQMNQVFNNLMINAIQAMPNGGTVHIGFENISLEAPDIPLLAGGDYIKITFRDEGIGIPEENLDRVFDPYFSTKAAGQGLGLATVNSILKRHQGYISAKSKTGIGTTFTLYIPAAKDIISPEKTKTGGLQFGNGRVLVMDDEQLVRSVAGEMLTMLGYEVGFAKDGKEAIEAYQQAEKEKRPFDVVIMDLTIPAGMGGREAVKKLHEISPEAKVIVSSGYSTDPIMGEYKKYGFRDVLVKPYNSIQMSEAISKVMKKT